MIHQREIVVKIRGMRAMDLLQLVLKDPHFLTDAYFAEIAKAVRARYEELKRVKRNASLMRVGRRTTSAGRAPSAANRAHHPAVP